ncbi:SUKH-4 family immunity protein [Streptomyces sp. NPDC087437]|uniref:SUKH-4 family immunity protein n=1 Tax=Streptomyces sp. NPDC087437 TaxID=3365789 RepID=UPI0037FFF9B6
MVTFAQAQERAEEWINGDVPAYQHREVRVREFELGFVVWAEDREGGPRLDGGAQRLVIARDSGEATLWPALPVGEVVRRYEEEYGRVEPAAGAAPAPPARVDLNQTSFLLSPPEWLQEAADRMGIPDRRGASGTGGGAAAAASAEAAGSGSLPQTQAGVPLGAPAGAGAPGAPAGATPWAGTDTNADTGDDRSVPLPATVFAPPLSGSDDDTPPPAAPPDAKTALMAGGSALPRTTFAPAVDESNGPVPPGTSPAPGAGYGFPQGPGGPGGPAAPGTPPPPSGPVGDAGYGFPQGPGGPGGPAAPGTPPPPSGPVGDAGYGYPHGPGGPGGPAAPGTPPPPPVPGAQAPGGAGHGRPLASNAGDIADAATSKAAPPPRRGGGSTTPPPPGAPGTPGVRPGGPSTPPPPGAAGGYVPTQMVSSLGPDGPEGLTGPGTPGGTPPGGVHHAATMFADPGQSGGGTPPPSAPPGAPGAPGAPKPPGASGASQPPTPPAGPGVPGAPGVPPGAPGMPGAPGAPGAVHHAETMLAAPPSGGPHTPPPPPGAPGAPGGPGMPGMPPGTPPPMAPGTPPPMPPGAVPPPGAPPMPGQVMPGQPPVPGQAMPGQPPVPGQHSPAYGYPQQGQPTVGPGYQAVLRYRAHDGSEQQLIRRSAPGTPHPEWQIFHELRAMNVPPDRVLELHTELESCELPGAYCARMIREQWPQARIASIAPYGTDHASRQQGMQQLLAHQGELHQVADGPARPGPVRAPLPPVQPVPPIPPEGIAQELAAAFGPGVFRFEQAAVSRQGVPPVVAHTLVVAGLPMDMGPFFWAQAQPGRPVPTLAELAAERGVQPASDAGSYLVMGSDFGKAICVQYGTANIVAVPVEAGPGGAPVAPQFVNTGLPEFARCLALLGRMWRLRFGLNQEQAGRWTVDFQAQLAALDPAALGSPESWWSVLLEQMWDGLL